MVDVMVDVLLSLLGAGLVLAVYGEALATTLTVGGAAVTVIHTPGHAPGAVCLYVHDLGCVFTGDTLFQGGPGATGRSYSDADLIVRSSLSRQESRGLHFTLDYPGMLTEARDTILIP